MAADRSTLPIPSELVDERLSSLSVFVPLANEAGSVGRVAADLLAVLPRVARRFELLLVDDGSTDGTGGRADAIAAAHPGVVRVVRHAVNRGYGAAVRSGLAHAVHEYVFFTDGDGQFRADGLVDLLPPLRTSDVVVGYRRRRADSLRRRLCGRAWSWLTGRLLGLPLRDVNCAFKIFRRSALEGVELTADGAAASAELMARVLRRGARVTEIPVAHFPRRLGRPTGGRLRVIGLALRELRRLRRDLAR